MAGRFLELARVGALALLACNAPSAAAGEPAAARASAAGVDAQPALHALDAISPDEWLHQSSAALLERVVQAASKAALDEAAKADPRAQALVGCGYYFGSSGYPQRDEEAAKYLRLGAASNPIAQTNLGAMLSNGRANGGTPSPEAAADFFRKAAAQGHPVAQLNLALLYRDGRGVAQDSAEAARLFALAAAQGNAQAQVELGDAYLLGQRGVRRNALEAERLYNAAADQGHADALYKVAALSDYPGAWFYQTEASGRRAEAYVKLHPTPNPCTMGDAAACASEANKTAGDEMVAFARSYSMPYYAKALAAYERDAARGSTHAMVAIGEMNYTGKGVAKNDAAAYASFRKAAALGDPAGLLSVGILTEQGEGVAKDVAAAVRIYQQLVASGDARGETELARMTLLGRGGLVADRAEALRLYKLAAKQGEERAQKALKQLGETW